MRSFASLLTLSLALTLVPDNAEARDLLKNCRQCLVVTTDSWSATHGTMSMFQRDKDSNWHRNGSAFPILVGRAGLGWGRGLTDTKTLPGPIKKEGDDKAPAGVFRLRSVFGSERHAAIKMPYLVLSPSIVAVNDSRSRFYNQLVDENKIRTRDWRSAEKMFGVDVYKWGVVVDHNTPPRPGAGSCIFLHTWVNPVTPTSGCTAMSQPNLLKIIRWLDPKLHPVLVQLPRAAYAELGQTWDLPIPPNP